jgi:hypothetical protein
MSRSSLATAVVLPACGSDRDLPAATVPATVDSLVASPYFNLVKLSWTAPTDGGSRIRYYVVREEGLSGSLAVTNSTAFTVDLVPDGTHCYRCPPSMS